jgi:hypothetical protein
MANSFGKPTQNMNTQTNINPVQDTIEAEFNLVNDFHLHLIQDMGTVEVTLTGPGVRLRTEMWCGDDGLQSNNTSFSIGPELNGKLTPKALFEMAENALLNGVMKDPAFGDLELEQQQLVNVAYSYFIFNG